MVRSRRKGETLKQTGLRLPTEILDRLRSGKLGLSDEIRDRLERTFKEDDSDPVTRELFAGLANIADLLRQDFNVQWHALPEAHEAFVTAVTRRLAAYKPSTPDTPVSSAVALDLLSVRPETAGVLREADDQRQNDRPHLKALQQRRISRLGQHIRAKQEGSDE